MIASAKEIDALNITLFNSCINFTNVHLCNYCTKIFVIIVNTCVCRRSVDNKALILSYPILSIVHAGGGGGEGGIHGVLFYLQNLRESIVMQPLSLKTYFVGVQPPK